LNILWILGINLILILWLVAAVGATAVRYTPPSAVRVAARGRTRPSQLVIVSSLDTGACMTLC
ncbi:MAG: hypothetical protein ACKOEY_14090, partial [Phenylobacterium sp.]